jgi:hypothetical protein
VARGTPPRRRLGLSEQTHAHDSAQTNLPRSRASSAQERSPSAHGQVDGSIVYNATRAVQLQAQVLNINRAVFGFYQGTPDHQFNIQREYYSQTFFLGTKIGF